LIFMFHLQGSPGDLVIHFPKAHSFYRLSELYEEAPTETALLWRPRSWCLRCIELLQSVYPPNVGDSDHEIRLNMTR